MIGCGGKKREKESFQVSQFWFYLMGDNSSVIKGYELTMINKVCNNTIYIYICLDIQM